MNIQPRIPANVRNLSCFAVKQYKEDKLSGGETEP